MSKGAKGAVVDERVAERLQSLSGVVQTDVPDTVVGQEEEVMRIPVPCPSCGVESDQRMLITSIPFFGEVGQMGSVGAGDIR